MSKKLFNQKATWEEAQQLPKEQAVRGIINTSIEDGKLALKKCDDLIVLEETLRREEEGAKRSGMLKPLKTKISKLRKEQGRLEITVDNNPEVVAYDPWEKAKNYVSTIKRLTRASIACQCMLGWELIALKKDLGYTQGRKKLAQRKSANLALFSTFEEHVTAETGLSKRTCYRFMEMADAAKSKLKSCFKHLPLLEKSILDFTDEELQYLEKAVEKVTDGQTQAGLLEEWKIAKAPQGSGVKGGNVSGAVEQEEVKEKQEPTMRQLAFALFADPVHNLSNLRTHSDYQKSLYALPVVSSTPEEVSLSTMEQEAESFLADIREAKAAAMKQTQPA